MKPTCIIKTIAILTAILTVSCIKDTKPAHLEPGDKIPEFATYTIESQNISNKDLTGKPSFIIHFSVTCPDCHKALPYVDKLSRIYSGTAYFLAMARGDGKDEIKEYWKQNGYVIPVVATGDRQFYELFDKGSKTGVPQIYISDAEGVVRSVFTDRDDPEKYEQALMELILEIKQKEDEDIL